MKKASDKAKYKTYCYIYIKMYKKNNWNPSKFICLYKQGEKEWKDTYPAGYHIVTGLWGWWVWDRKRLCQFS